ncbi:MAG: hypothetical protein IPP49_15590 [Saprospiraceae bacterium]|nr:hypothetical protein [Saprospiraceae bacterium]
MSKYVLDNEERKKYSINSDGTLRQTLSSYQTAEVLKTTNRAKLMSIITHLRIGG